MTKIIIMTILYSGVSLAETIQQGKDRLHTTTAKFVEEENPWKSWTVIAENMVNIPKEMSQFNKPSRGLFAWVGVSKCNLCFTEFRHFSSINELYQIFLTEFDEENERWSETRRIDLQETFNRYFLQEEWCNRGFMGTGKCKAPMSQVWQFGFGEQTKCPNSAPSGGTCFLLEVEIRRNEVNRRVGGDVRTTQVVQLPGNADTEISESILQQRLPVANK
ncbi:MAG: hypothetical protein IPK68_20170 [Bdellovibrionales bacterium]|nr:hypothetical protein [Bdellovibrionales bacterium]